MENNLKLLGTHPDAVGKVILTHSHYDHISNIALFKNAEVYISAKEFEFLHSQSNEAGEHLSEAKEHLDRMDKAGKLFLVGNDLKVDDDIRIRWIGGHTPGSQMVFTDTVRGKFLITGDAVFLRENVTKRIPIGLTRDAGQSKNVIAVCGQFEGECLPSHDLSVLSFFKEG
jgi:glyoxylase-like metal-dependent hydrolase (beta-lactamase superfamily II)